MLPEEVLTREEIERMIQAARNPRDKAFIAVLYESGCRIGELLPVRIRQVQWDDLGAVLIVHGKTGSRRVRLIESVDLLRLWLRCHPNPEPDAFLWVGRDRIREKPLNYRYAREILKRAAKRAGVHKRVNPHAFRHARATHLASVLSTPQLCVLFGWVQGSKIPATYVHLSGADVEDALLKIYGLKKQEEEERRCPRCGAPYLLTENFCKSCGLPLNVQVAVERDQFRERIIAMERVLEMLLSDEEVRKKLADLLDVKGNSQTAYKSLNSLTDTQRVIPSLRKLSNKGL